MMIHVLRRHALFPRREDKIVDKVTSNAIPLQLFINNVGKIIGRGGEVITMIQQRSGAKVQIDQNVPEGKN